MQLFRILLLLLTFSNTYSTLQGYIPELNNGPNDCCSHSSQWDDPFTLMCQTCAYDVLGKGITDITYKWYDNNVVQYETTCSSTSRYSVSCSGTNNQNGGHPSYHATCNDDCLLSDAQPFIDLCISSLPPKNSLEKSKNRVFQIKSWQSGCEKKKQTLTECKTACNSPQGCCGTTCAGNSCSGGGCCAASKRICEKACNFYFSPGEYNIIDINVTNYINETRWINETRYINTTRWINKTRWINETIYINTTRWIDAIRWINKTNIINVKKVIEKTNWINRTRWINKTNIINVKKVIEKTNWINRTRWINKTQWTKRNNETIRIIKKESEHMNDKKGNETGFQIDFNNILVLSGISIGGILICSCSFYVAWECWLKEHIEEMIINYLCCGYGEQFMTIMEWGGFFEDWEKRKETREDGIEFYGLTPEQIVVCKRAKSINILKYKEALKIVWEEQSKHATRPDDPCHRLLLGKIKSKRDIEMIDIPEKVEELEEQHENTVIKILPGTPRRRVRIMEI